jgi:hypothetical protein
MNVAPQGLYFLVMEFLEGRSLQALTRGPVEPAVAIPILMQVCDALAAAHSHGVIHRDLKPENIFLTRRGGIENFVKVLDFGIAKLFSEEGGEQTSAGVIIGTPEYMAPEQATGERPDGRADIYSLGIIGYLLATGRLPFSSGGLTGLLLAHREKVPPAPHEVNPAVSRPWSDAIMRAIAKRPTDRFVDAKAFRDALQSALRRSTEESAAAVNAAVPAPPIATPKPEAKLAGTPHPIDSRHLAAFDARWYQSEGRSVELPCMDVSRGGLFLCSSGDLPAIFSRVKLVLNLADGPLPCTGEVVRHVTSEQARAWNMSPGFGVQFVEVDATFKDRIGRFVHGLPPAKAVAVPVTAEDDRDAEVQLEYYRKRINGDHYVVLSLEPDVEFSEVRQRGREVERELAALKARRLSPKQTAQVVHALEKVQQAVDVLGHAPKRVVYDGNRGNYRGVGRCIAAGLTVTELEALRKDYLIAHASSEAAARIHFTTATAWESHGNTAMALGEYEQALAMDPLNLSFHQRYWTAKRKNPSATPRS